MIVNPIPPSAYLKVFAVVFAAGVAMGAGIQGYANWASRQKR